MSLVHQTVFLVSLLIIIIIIMQQNLLLTNGRLIRCALIKKSRNTVIGEVIF